MRFRNFFLLFLCTMPAFAQFKFQTVDVPGSVETQVRAINSRGDIAGFYRTSSDSCIPFATPNLQVSPCDEHGFTITDGKLTTRMVPGSLSTAIMGMNDLGDMVGYYTRTSEACVIEQHGFIWSHRNVITQLDFSGSTGFCGTDALWTVPFSINNQGTVVGAVWSPLDGMPSGGFMYRKGVVTEMSPTGLEGGCFSCTSLSGITNGGVIVGSTYRVYGLIPMWVGFMKRGNDEIYFTRTQDDSWATGVNASGDVVGFGVYGAGYFVRHLSRQLRQGSLVVSPTLVPVYYPDAVGTFPFAINNATTIVGAYMSVDGALHGFVAAPAH